MEKRIVPLKNYLILLVVGVCTFGLVFYLMDLYKTKYVSNNNNSVLLNTISELSYDEMSNYLLENPNTVIYFSSYDQDLNTFEDEFSKFIIEEGLKKEILYVDYVKLTKQKKYNSFVKKYISEDLKSAFDKPFTTILIVEDGLCVKSIYIEKQNIKMEDVKSFLISEGVIEND